MKRKEYVPPSAPKFYSNKLEINVQIIPKIQPALINTPVLKLSPTGQIISTPKSKATAMMGKLTNPQQKVSIQQSQACPSLKNKNSKKTITVAQKQMILTAVLKAFVFSTQMPKATQPKIPPTINIPPKLEPSWTVQPYFVLIRPNTPPRVLKTP